MDLEVCIRVRELIELLRCAVQEAKRIFFGTESKNESGCWAEAIMFMVESSDVRWSHVPHCIRHAAVVEAKWIVRAENKFVQFKVVLIDALSRLHLVVNGALFDQA